MTLSTKEQSAAAAANQQPEKSLIHNARNGDSAAWEALMHRYQQPAFRLAYLILGDAADAEDVAQEAFIRAYFALEKFDDARPLQPWLLQIVRNLARNRQRGLSRYWSYIKSWRQQQPEPVVHSGHQERAEARLLWQAVRRLKPDWQEIIYLRYFLDLSEAETAAALEIPTGTVKSRLHRALKALKPLVEKDFIV